MIKPDNGNRAAFTRPVSVHQQGPHIVRHEDGLTKRELLAAMALQGMLANSAPDILEATREYTDAAEWAVGYADALLAELAK